MNWSSFKDLGELYNEAAAHPPVQHPHALLLQDPPGSFAFAWYWFGSAEDRVAWIQRALEVEGELSGEQIEAVVENVRALGEGPAEEDELGFCLGGSDAAWLGTLEQLRFGDHPHALKCRADFWESEIEDEELSGDEYEKPRGSDPRRTRGSVHRIAGPLSRGVWAAVPRGIDVRSMPGVVAAGDLVV